jgi:hypothetical protein
VSVETMCRDCGRRACLTRGAPSRMRGRRVYRYMCPSGHVTLVFEDGEIWQRPPWPGVQDRKDRV